MASNRDFNHLDNFLRDQINSQKVKKGARNSVRSTAAVSKLSKQSKMSGNNAIIEQASKLKDRREEIMKLVQDSTSAKPASASRASTLSKIRITPAQKKLEERLVKYN